MRAADWIVDIGPGAGVHGGEVVAQGTVEDIIAEPRQHHRAVPLRRAAHTRAGQAPRGEREKNLSSAARARTI